MSADAVAPADRLSLPLRAGWGLGSVGTVLVLSTYSTVLLFYLTTVVGIAATLAGTVLLTAKLVDAAFAPVVGAWSDRTVTRWGRRRPFLFAGALISALGAVVIFHPPMLGDGALPYIIGGLVVFAIGYSLFNVPYLAMPAEMTGSPAERTSLISWRIAFVSVGGIGAAFLPKVAQTFGGGLGGYGGMGWVLALAVGATMLIACFASAGARAPSPSRPAPGGWRAVLESRDFLLLLAAKVFQLVGLASSMASMLFMLTYVIKADPLLLGLYAASSALTTIAVMPLWTWVSRGRSKRGLYVLGCLGFAAVTLTWLLTGPGEPVPVTIGRGIAAGVFSGLLLLMGQSLLPDVIDADCKRTGERREGVYAAAYSVVEKLSTATGPFLIGVILTSFGFKPGQGAVQGADLATGVFIGTAILPALFYALSVLPLLAMYRGARPVAVTA